MTVTLEIVIALLATALAMLSARRAIRSAKLEHASRADEERAMDNPMLEP